MGQNGRICASARRRYAEPSGEFGPRNDARKALARPRMRVSAAAGIRVQPVGWVEPSRNPSPLGVPQGDGLRQGLNPSYELVNLCGPHPEEARSAVSKDGPKHCGPRQSFETPASRAPQDEVRNEKIHMLYERTLAGAKTAAASPAGPAAVPAPCAAPRAGPRRRPRSARWRCRPARRGRRGRSRC